LDQAQAPICLLDEKDQGFHGQLQRAYVLALEVLIKKFIQLFLLNWGQGVDLGAEVVNIQYEFDGMVPLLPIGKFFKGLLGGDISEFLEWLGHYVFEACQ